MTTHKERAEHFLSKAGQNYMHHQHQTHALYGLGHAILALVEQQEGEKGEPAEYNSLEAEYEVMVNMLERIRDQAKVNIDRRSEFYTQSIFETAEYGVSQGRKILQGIESDPS